MKPNRVIALARPAPHYIHAFRVVRHHRHVEYQACTCGTRRIVVGPKAETYDSGWLRTGEFADEAGVLVLPLEWVELERAAV